MPSSTAPKIQRWIDLIAALLALRSPRTFEELAREVPAYLADGSVRAGRASETLKRMFERDKKELKALGVPIQTVGEEGSDESAYRMATTDFYLPYLTVATPRGRVSPRKVDRYGYRALATLAFEPDELAVVAEAAQRARQLGDPALTADAESAMRKLAFDLPVGAAAPGDTHVVAVRARATPEALRTLGDALLRKKRVTFDYRAMDRDAVSERAAEPYGLVFLGGHWYLIGRDTDRDAVRQYRVSRMSNIRVNSAKAATPDFDIPAGFDLATHARSRQSWELGDGDAVEAIVEFRAITGVAMAAAALGRAVPGDASRRAFLVRRLDAFVRWLLSFAGDARPVSPPELVGQFRRVVAETRAVYDAGAR